MDTLMWEARAAEGRTDELASWAGARAAEVRALPGCERVEVFRAPDERVVLIAVVRPEAPHNLLDPPTELVHRPPHAWRFQRLPDE